MKKWTHLYVFAILSGISSLWGLYGVFKPFDAASLEPLKEIPNGHEMVAVTEATALFQTNLLNKCIALVLVALLGAVVFLLVKKRFETASYMYMGYLFMTLIRSTYTYIGAKGALHLYSDSQMRQFADTGVLGFYGLQILLFAIFLGLTVLFHFRKPKPIVNLASSGTDI